MYLACSNVFVLAITISFLEILVHHSSSALPVKKLMPQPGGMQQDADNVQPVADEPPHEEAGLKFKKEEQIGNPVNNKGKIGTIHGEAKLDVEHVKSLGKLPIDKLKPADHIDGVKMEQDGHVNLQYHKELFLGQAHDEFKTETFDEAQDKLKEIVNMADVNKDGSLSKTEMELWIKRNMDKHFADAEVENDIIFKHLDPDGNGLVTWMEYYLHFLVSRGVEVEKAIKVVKDYDERGDDTSELLMEDKDILMSYKFRWSDADSKDKDDQLSKAEFMVFRHPEHSKNSLDLMVRNLITSVDTNDDLMISLEEFSALPPGEVEGKEFQDMDRKWQEDRRKEFREIMDINHDGLVTSKELERYLDPTNPIQAKIETESLLSLIDDNKDDQLSMDEIMRHSEIFITSKLANFAANVHEEL